MSIIEAISLGIVQGLTEFIPVSSSGHLVFFRDLFGWEDSGLLFDVTLHFGTFLALVIFFHKDIWNLVRSLFDSSRNNTDKRLAYFLLIATIPTAIAGWFLEETANTAFRSSLLGATTLIVVAFFMLWAEKHSAKLPAKTEIKKITLKQALLVGLAQVLSLVPGISRSGSTITAGLFVGMDRVAATRFAFLLGIPITAGAILKMLTSGTSFEQIQSEQGAFIVGVLAAFISGIFAISFLLRYLAKHTLNIFAYYRIALGVIILAVIFL